MIMSDDEILKIAHINKHVCIFDDVPDSDIIDFARAIEAKAVAKEREACASIAERKYNVFKDTAAAHYRASETLFIPKRFGFDLVVIEEGVNIAEAIRARGE